MRVAFDTISGKHYEGELIEIDNNTAILQLDDGTKKACAMEGLYQI